MIDCRLATLLSHNSQQLIRVNGVPGIYYYVEISGYGDHLTQKTVLVKLNGPAGVEVYHDRLTAA